MAEEEAEVNVSGSVAALMVVVQLKSVAQPLPVGIPQRGKVNFLLEYYDSHQLTPWGFLQARAKSPFVQTLSKGQIRSPLVTIGQCVFTGRKVSVRLRLAHDG